MSDGDVRKVEPRRKNTAERREPWKLSKGMILKSGKGKEYIVDVLLGKGGFGEVWQVALYKEPTAPPYAMKLESNFAEPGKESQLRLKMEVGLFDVISKAPNKIDKTHFVKMHDTGKTIDFKYYVMDLVWMSLKELKQKVCGDVFSPPTLIQIARQTLKAIESIHMTGFLHRDIKPANFAAGLPPKDGIIYILDFGICKPFLDKNGNVKKPRKTTRPFMGTPMYASTDSQCCKEQARRDDLECWLYMMLDLYDYQNLPWASLEKDEVDKHIDLRMELLSHSRELHKAGKLKVPEKWCDIIDNLNGMGFEEEGDFTQLNLTLNQLCVEENIDSTLPLDWVGKYAKWILEKPKEEPRKPSEKKREPRKKKTAEKVEAKEAEGKKRRKEESGSDREESEEEESDDYETYLRWKKRRQSRKKGSHNKHNNDVSDRARKPPPPPPAPRKKPSKEKKRSEADKEAKAPEVKDHPEVDKRVATPEKKEAVEDKRNVPTPEKSPIEVKHELKLEKIVEVKKKKAPEEEKEARKQHVMTKTPESNESNNEREDKLKEKKKKKRKKKGNKTPEGSKSQDEYDDIIKIADEHKKMVGVRKKDTNNLKKKKDEMPAEKPALKAPVAEPKKAPDLRKSDGRK